MFLSSLCPAVTSGTCHGLGHTDLPCHALYLCLAAYDSSSACRPGRHRLFPSLDLAIRNSKLTGKGKHHPETQPCPLTRCNTPHTGTRLRPADKRLPGPAPLSTHRLSQLFRKQGTWQGRDGHAPALPARRDTVNQRSQTGEGHPVQRRKWHTRETAGDSRRGHVESPRGCGGTDGCFWTGF